MNAWKPGQKAYNYNNEGQLTSLTYPSSHTYSGGSWQVVPGRMYVYGFDSMGRPNRMYTIEDRQYDLVKDVVYGPASNLTQVRYLETKGASAPEDVYYLHTNTYNTLQQLTRMTTVREGGGGGTIMDMEYRFPAAQNNGRITQQKDWVSGEEVSYQYDSLQRLISAVTTGPEWGQSFSYDGFGNLLAKSVTKGSAPALSVNVDGATNRITTAGFGYDANGNLTAIPGVSGVAYDGRNRLTAAGGDQYSYRPDNKRLWKKLPGGTEEVYFYSIRGERLGTYEPAVDGTVLYLKFKSTEVYFAGSLIRSQGQAVVLDRLGSVRSFGGTAMRYFPYGEEQTSTPNGRPKFGTYFRDESTGLDYANQRYYGSGMGRFLTPDPYQGSAGAADPGSWNRSTYVGADPVNANDPTGLCIWCAELLMFPTDAGGGGVIWRSAAPWPGPWIYNPIFYGSGFIQPTEAGIDCGFNFRPSEDPYCSVWRLVIYTQIAAGFSGGGGGGGGGAEGQSAGKIECRFDKYSLGDTAYGKGEVEGRNLSPGYHRPISFYFSAVGGDAGTFRWTNRQDVRVVGTVQYSGPPKRELSIDTSFSEALANNAPPFGPEALLFDAPGIAHPNPTYGNIVAANITQTFSLYTRVSRGGATAICPTVYWFVTIEWPKEAAGPTITVVVRP